MKKLTGLALILAVLILGGYYGMGVLTERTIKRNIAVINQSNGLVAQLEEYSRGWFTSDAKIKWRLHVPQHINTNAQGQAETIPAQIYHMDMPVKVYHGPIIVADQKVRFGMGYAETVFAFPEQYKQQFDELFTKDSTKPQLDLSIFVNYLNKSTVELSVPAFKLISSKGNGDFDWQGMESITSMSPEMGKVDGKIRLDGIKLSKEDAKMTIGKIATEYDLHQTSAGLYLGGASFTLPALDLIIKDQKIFEVNELSVNSNSDIEESLFSTHFAVALKSIFANSRTYGPGDLEITLRNLDADVLARINQQVTAMQNNPSDVERQKAMIAILPELPKLFSKGAEFEISRFTVQIPEGTVDGNLFVSLPKEDSSNPFELMQKIQGNARLKMPAVVVKQVLQQSVAQQIARQPELQQVLIQQLQAANALPQGNTAIPANSEQIAALQADKQVKTLEQNGVIKIDGSDYVVDVQLQQGKFSINGKPFESSMLKF